MALSLSLQETDLHPSIGGGSYVGTDGRHDRKPRLNPLDLGAFGVSEKSE